MIVLTEDARAVDLSRVVEGVFQQLFLKIKIDIGKNIEQARARTIGRIQPHESIAMPANLTNDSRALGCIGLSQEGGRVMECHENYIVRTFTGSPQRPTLHTLTHASAKDRQIVGHSGVANPVAQLSELLF